jgi:hypothetical protein
MVSSGYCKMDIPSPVLLFALFSLARPTYPPLHQIVIG